MAKRYTKNKKRKHIKKSRKYGKNMRGGFTADDNATLQHFGFDEAQINQLETTNLPIAFIIDFTEDVQNQYNEDPNVFNGNDIQQTVVYYLTHDGQQYYQEYLNQNLDIEPIPHNEQYNLDMGDDDENPLSDDEDELNMSNNSSLHDSDLMGEPNGSPNTSIDTGVTENWQDNLNAANMNNSFSSFGTNNSLDSSLSDISNISNMSVNGGEQDGGKRRKRKTNKRIKKGGKKTRKNKRTKRQQGGMCYGRGVGANSYDPNYSIYNTNLTKLFPYRA